jgi:hypothetical protein
LYDYWELNLRLEAIRSRYVRYLFDDLGSAIDKAEGGRLESHVVNQVADTVLGKAGRSIEAFEELAKQLPAFSPRMKRVSFAAPENGMETRYFVFPVEATDAEISTALATEASRDQITKWARTEPPRLDLILVAGGEVRNQTGLITLKTPTLLADYHRQLDELPGERLATVLAFLGTWLGPAIVVYLLGAAVGWVIRGFRQAG